MIQVQYTNFNSIANKLEEQEYRFETASTAVTCNAVYANNQGGEDQLCNFYHSTLEGTKQRGKIIQLSCGVKFYCFLPILVNGAPSTNHIAVVCYGVHDHPPPPPHRIPETIKDRLTELIRAYGVGEVTARKLIASPLLPIMLSGETKLTKYHKTLQNLDAVGNLIRRERAKEFPWGTDFHGALYLKEQEQKLQLPKYIRRTGQLDSGHFIVHCQSKEQSIMLMNAMELHADKTFSRTKCKEFEVNTYDPISRRILTVARVFFDDENEDAYFEAFKTIFDTAESDTGHRVPFGHLMDDAESPTGSRIKAILLDEHAGQIRGLAKYFQMKYPKDEHDFHVLRIVKTCGVHFLRSVNKLAKANHHDEQHQSNVTLIDDLTIRIMQPSQNLA